VGAVVAVHQAAARVAQVAHQLVAQVEIVQQTVRLLLQTRLAVAVVQGFRLMVQVVQVVQELFTLGGRFNRGTLCKSRKQCC
jgi:hypothetical protein